MKKLLFAGILLGGVLLAGCGTGETTEADIQRERDAIKAQTPSGLAPVDPGNDMMKMGGGGGAPAGGGATTMPKGIRGQGGAAPAAPPAAAPSGGK